MALEVRPPLPDEVREALKRALAEAGIGVDEPAEPYRSAWRLVAAQEAVDETLDPTAALSQLGDLRAEGSETLHALSPRSTRGATRA